jgi:hypothetical protein
VLAVAFALGFGVALLGAAPRAAAQSSPQDQATARTLFNEARQLMKDGRYLEACPKLESASVLYVGPGLLLNLGDCYEHLGRTASAWTAFGESVTAAERAGRQEDMDEAHRRQSAVEAKLSRLVVRVQRDARGLVVRRDGADLARALWGEAVPLDPGEHTVTAEAPGFVPWTGSASVVDAGKTVVITVPALSPAPSGAAVDGAPGRAGAGVEADGGARPGYWTSRRVASASLAAVGLIAAGTGGALALVAKQHDEAARTETVNRNADSTSAVGLGNTATVVVGAGAVVMATGLLLWLTAPDAPVHVGALPGGVTLAGTF